MVLLSNNQVDKIHDLLLDQGVHYDPLRVDLLDHLCCIVEEQMGRGQPFEKALNAAVREFGPGGLHETQEATIYLLTLKFRIMKKIMSFIGIAGGVLTFAGVLFKIFAISGAGVGLVTGIFLICFLYLPLLLAVKFREVDSTSLKLTYAVGILAAIVLGLSVMFKFMHWPYSNALMGISLLIQGLVFMPVYFTHSYKLAENKLSNLAFVAVLFAAVFAMYGLTNPRNSNVMANSVYVMHQSLMNDVERTSNERKMLMARTGDDLKTFNTSTENLLAYIRGMRTKAVMVTQDISSEQAENLNIYEMAWAEGTREIQSLLTSKNSEYNSGKLESLLNNWKKAATEAGVPEESLQYWIPTQPIHTPRLNELSWEEAYFGNATVLSVVTYLDQLALEVNQRYIQTASKIAV